MPALLYKNLKHENYNQMNERMIILFPKELFQRDSSGDSCHNKPFEIAKTFGKHEVSEIYYMDNGWHPL